AWGYALSAFGKQQPVLASAPSALLAASKTNVLRVIIFSLAVFLIAQLGIIILLLFVVVQGVFVYSRTKGTLTLTVLLAFLMIFVAHVILFSSVVFLSADLYLFGNVVQFLGFLALLFFLYTSGRVGPS
ncbi:MAG TPA: hypothetical protein VEJ36_01585, partial [Nitrososphaerales archaeon]|nr:hypothetical protein [Nitrososphaerales archaeon]